MNASTINGLRRRATRIVRRISPDELELYRPVIAPDVARKVWLVQLPAIPGPYSGLTIANLVIVDRTLPPGTPSALLAHELVHVRQFHDKGVLRFTLDYNTSFVAGLVTERGWSKAYRAIPAEVEARSETTRWLHESARNKAVAEATVSEPTV